MSEASIIVTTSGRCECLYTEAVDLAALGNLSVRRATDIVFDSASQKWCVLNTGGKILFCNGSREICLGWERRHLEQRETAKHGGLK
jgi:hypothetical protein